MSQEKANARINNQTASVSKKSHMGLMILLFVMVVCILGGVIVSLLLRKDPEDDREHVYRNNVVTPDNVEEIISALKEEEYTPVGYYEVSMTNEWVFPDGSSPSSTAKVENPVTNRNTVYFTVAIDEDDIYSSPYLEPGSHIENITLDQELAAGIYEAVLTYHLVDSDLKETSSLSVTVDITIEK